MVIAAMKIKVAPSTTTNTRILQLLLTSKCLICSSLEVSIHLFLVVSWKLVLVPPHLIDAKNPITIFRLRRPLGKQSSESYRIDICLHYAPKHHVFRAEIEMSESIS